MVRGFNLIIVNVAAIDFLDGKIFKGRTGEKMIALILNLPGNALVGGGGGIGVIAGMNRLYPFLKCLLLISLSILLLPLVLLSGHVR